MKGKANQNQSIKLWDRKLEAQFRLEGYRFLQLNSCKGKQ